MYIAIDAGINQGSSVKYCSSGRINASTVSPPKGARNTEGYNKK
ncbi:hypothetical protein C5S53_01225 [Methanophagales archaeon]|nr:hypothetical protein C5S53_01225 [Methanophagales archaeon]